MSVLAWLLALTGAALAAATAAADGALSAPESRNVPGAENAHRALAVARVFAYLGLGAGVTRGVLRSVATAPAYAGVAIVVVVIGAVLVLDSVIRASASARGLAAAARWRPFTLVVSAALRPIVRIGTGIEAALGRLIPPSGDPEATREATAERLREVLEAEADATAGEATLLHRAFALARTSVGEIMAPRVDIVGVEADTPWSEVLDRVRSEGHARVPVYRETLDDVIGILYAKDLLLWSLANDEPNGGWRALVRPVMFIPASKTIDRQLREFRKSGTHIAIVVDEFGGTAGLITIEDVLEEIVGEIRDERDVDEADIEREGGERFWVRGTVPLGDLSDALGVSLERPDVTTVGGLMYDAFGRVPRSGDETTIDGFRVVVERVRRRRVERVYFERQHQPSAAHREES